MLFGRISPASLVLSTLSLLVASAPVPVDSKATPELRQLSGTNFTTSLKQNDWFVEFFSPYCGHCKSFKPTWEELVVARDDPPRLNLAQVDCIANGDLCNTEHIKYYPTIRLYRNHPNGTQTQELFEKSRTLDLLQAFLDERVPKLPPAEGLPVPAFESNSKEHLMSTTKYNLDGKVISLGTNNFQEKITSEPTLVKFYAPWCGHCQKLAPKWIELASELKEVVNVAEVNCDVHGNLCRDAGIEGYPTVAFYLNGKKIDYTGSKTVPAMSAWVRKAMAPGVVSVDDAEFNRRLKDEEVVFLLLHSEEDKRVVDVVSTAGRTLLGQPPVFESTSKRLFTQYGLPSPSTSMTPVLLAIKSHSSGSYAAKLNLDGLSAGINQGNAEGLEKWLQRNRFPYASKLSMDNFYSVMKNPTNPFVVLMAVDAGEDASVNDENREDEVQTGPEPKLEETLSPLAFARVKELEEISKAWSKEGSSKDKERETVFVWMDGRRWSKWLKSMYGMKNVGQMNEEDGISGTALVVVDHRNLLYYDEDAYGRPMKLTKNSIFSTLNSIYAGKGVPKHSENMLERVARSVNDRVIALGEYVKTHIKTTIFGSVFFFVILFYALRLCINSDLPTPNDYYVASEDKKGRLD